MPTSEFFRKLGLFVRPSFLSTQLCRKITGEVLKSPQDPLEVVDGFSSRTRIKSHVRRSQGATVSDSTVALAHATLRTLREELESHFGLSLVDCEKPQFLAYTKGDFFRPHVDGDNASEKPEYIRKRKLSIIIFLNSAISFADSFEGGALVLYGLIEDPRWKQYGFQFVGEEGMLIAFPSDLVHEIKPIVRGRRCTIVSWFHE
jgi:predicted 2-oxoglutarate/Fe(II)-dependent dioxygenase YbiX